MKKNILFAIGLFSSVLASCDPVEDRDELSGGITAEQLNISATPVVRDGANSNYIELNSDGNGCLSSWDYGFGTLVGTKGTVKVMTTGPNEIIYTGLNADGTKITKTLTVNVEKLYDVDPEWALFCGEGEKTWVWDDSQPAGEDGTPAVWGNGGYKGNVAPGWWKPGLASMEGQLAGNGEGASMIFAIKGATLTKVRTDGITEKGTFTFDTSSPILNDGGEVWAIGKLFTKNVSVLAGICTNEGNAEVHEYDLVKLNDDKMVLCYPEKKSGGASWGTAWFWMFRAKE